LKEQVIANHFNDHEEYKTNKGLLLASYKGVSSQIFQGAKFKVAHPELAAQFTKRKSVSDSIEIIRRDRIMHEEPTDPYENDENAGVRFYTRVNKRDHKRYYNKNR